MNKCTGAHACLGEGGEVCTKFYFVRSDPKNPKSCVREFPEERGDCSEFCVNGRFLWVQCRNHSIEIGMTFDGYASASTDSESAERGVEKWVEWDRDH